MNRFSYGLRTGLASGVVFIAALAQGAEALAQGAVQGLAQASVHVAAHVQLPAQPLGAALTDLARQTGVSILYTPQAVAGRTSVAVSGNYSAKDAAQILVRGAPLEVVAEGVGTLVVRPQAGARASVSALGGHDVRGQVREANQGLVLPGAVVRLVEHNRQVTADEDGQFTFRGVAPGTYTLEADYIGYGHVRQSVTLADADADTTLVFGSQGTEVREVVVTGQRLADRKALQSKKSANNTQDGIFADDVGKLPDQNVAEALRRVPAVSVADDQGEGRYVVVRGVDPNLANVTINGAAAPAPEPEGRQVKLDTIPSSLIGSVTVIKSLTPDLDANAIAGQVNIDTLSAFDRKGPFLYGRLSNGRYEINHRTPVEGDMTVGGRVLADKSLGLVLSGNYSRRPLESQNLQGSSNWVDVGGRKVPDDFRIRDYNLTRVRKGVSANFDYRPSGAVQIFGQILYSEFSDSERRDQFRIEIPVAALSNMTDTTGSFAKARGTRFLRMRTEEDKTVNYRLGGRFELWGGLLNIEADSGRAEKKDPLRSEWAFRTSSSALAGNYDLSSTVFIVTPSAAAYDGSKFAGNSFTLDTRLAVETLNQLRADYSHGFEAFGGQHDLKFGVKWMERHKTNNRDIQTYDVSASLTLDKVSDGVGKDTYDGRYVLGPRINYDMAKAAVTANPSLLKLNASKTLANSLINDYDVRETISSAYVMGTLKFGALTVVPGVRVEHTEGDYKSKAATATATVNDGYSVFGKKSYTDVFPGVNARYDLTKDLIVRAAVTTSIGRPNYSDLSPYVSVDAAAGSVSMGNPNLKPLKAINYDAGLEYYLPGQGLLSAALFMKMIDNPIYSRGLTVTNGTFGGISLPTASVTRPENVDEATVTGLELNAQTQFGFLPTPFDGFGVAANATFLDAKAKGVFGRSGSVPLALSSKQVTSAQLFYEKGPLSARVAYAYRSRYLDTLGADASTDQYTADHGQLDARISYKVLPQLTVFMEGSNLNRAQWRRFVGNSHQLVENERYGQQYRLGLQLKY